MHRIWRRARSAKPAGSEQPKAVPINPPPEWKARSQSGAFLYPAPGGRMRNHRLVRPNAPAFGDERAARSPKGRNSPKAVPINPPPEWKARSQSGAFLYPAPGGRMMNHRLVRPNAPHLATSAKPEARRVGTAKRLFRSIRLRNKKPARQSGAFLHPTPLRPPAPSGHQTVIPQYPPRSPTHSTTTT